MTAPIGAIRAGFDMFDAYCCAFPWRQHTIFHIDPQNSPEKSADQFRNRLDPKAGICFDLHIRAREQIVQDIVI